jgi:hypothetical protein
MPLSPMDDTLAHQTPDPFDTVFTSDRRFYDRYYFNCHPSADDLFLITGMGQYPNLGVTDAFVTISHGHTHYVVRASRELGSDRSKTVVGPLGVEVLEGLRRMRVWCAPNEWNVDFDLVYRATVPPLHEPKGITWQGTRKLEETSRFAQVGTWEGRISVGGETYDVTPDRWKGARDHSWGFRPGVGEPEPPGIAAKVGPHGRLGFFHQWIPMQFEDYMIKVFMQEDHEGNRLMEEAVKVYNLGDERPNEELGTPKHEITFKSGTREIERAVISFSSSDLVVTNHPLRTNYLMAGSGYGQGADWSHGMYQGELVVQGLTYDMSDPEVFATMQGLNETLCRFEANNGDVGFGMHENALSGIYRPYGFDAPGAVAP